MKLAIDIHNEIINLYQFDNNNSCIAAYKFLANSINSIKYKILEYISNTGQITGIGISAKQSTLLNNTIKACHSIFTADTWVFNYLECHQQFNLPVNINVQKYDHRQLAIAIAVRTLYPHDNFIMVDLNTSITVSVFNKANTYLGGLILSDLASNLNSNNTKQELLQSNPADQVVAGNYYAAFYGLKGILDNICDSYFDKDIPIIIATGEFAESFKNSGLFDKIIPNLAALGTMHAIENRHTINRSQISA